MGHNSRDSTAIEAREKPLKKEVVQKVAAKRGRPKQGEERVKPLTRIEQQASGMGLADMLTTCRQRATSAPRKTARVIKSAGLATSYTLMWRMAAFPLVRY